MFSHITIVNIDGRHGELTAAQLSLAHSARQLPGAQALLLSPQRPKNLLEGIQHVPIQPLGYIEYGLFVLYALHRFIRTEFALIVQDDGWVLSGGEWRNDYCNYDYIGAPSHLGRVTKRDATTYLTRFQWVDHLADESTRVDFVMNGGFSLRSKKLLQAPTALGLPFVLPAVSGLNGPPHEMYWTSNSHLEDVQLCIDMRSTLEQAGVKFAPLEVAKNFAFEHLWLPLHQGLDFATVLGHHSRIRKLTALDPVTVRYEISRNDVSRVVGEKFVVDLFQRKGYQVSFP
jgi:hypothetical protein